MRDLVLKAQNGDEQAFTELILMMEHDLFKIAKMRLTNDADIEDAVQDAMIEAFKCIKQLKDPDAFKSWIIKILINKCNKIYRKKRINEISYIEDIENYLIQEADHLGESDINFYELLKCLNNDDRMIVTLFYLEHYTSKEISQMLNINENTIKTKLARSKDKIKTDYKEGII